VAEIRLATPADGAQLSAIYAPLVRDTAISFAVDPPDAVEMARRIAKSLLAFPWLVADAGGEVLGYVYASKHRARAAYLWSVDTTVTWRRFARRPAGRRRFAAGSSMLRV
jgi:L-amino acid N-acyltransferase YncA